MTAPFPWDLPGHVAGIDIASPQAGLSDEEWDAIEAAGIITTSIKATEAVSGVDPALDRHQAAALAHHQVVDFYAFLHSDLSGKAQAEHFARNVEKRPRMARWWADFEDQQRIAPDPARALANLVAFMDRGADLLGEPGGIYTGPGVIAHLRSLPAADLAVLAKWDLWVAHYRIDPANGHDYGLTAPTIPAPWKSAVGWQVYGDKGPRITAIVKGKRVTLRVDVDRDAYYGDRAHFEAWRHKYDRHDPGGTFDDTHRARLTSAAMDAAADEPPDEVA